MVNQSIGNIERAKKDLEEILDAIPIALFTHDKEFRIMRANSAYAELAGMSFKDMLGKPYYEVFPRKEKPFKKCIEILELQQQKEEVFLPEIKKIYRMRYYPVMDKQKKYRFSIHILEDVTEAKQSEEKIKAEAEINRALLEVAEVLSKTLNRDEIFKKVTQIVPTVIKADRCAVFLYDKENRAFVSVHSYGMPRELKPYFAKLKLTTEIPMVDKIIKGETVIIKDVHESQLFPKEIAETFGLRSVMIVPITVRREVIGILWIDRIEIKIPFSDKDQSIVLGISYQIATSLQNAMLFMETMEKTMELSHRIETIQIMHEIDKSILSTLEPQEILETATVMISKVIPCDRITVYLVEKERLGFIYAAGFGLTFVTKGAFVPFGDTSATEIIKTGRPLYVANLMEIKELLPMDKRLIEGGFLSHIRVPLIVKNEVIGVLNVGSKKTSAFTHEDLLTLEKLASQISVALENARLISDLKELCLGTIKSLSSAIDAKSPWTKGHSDKVAEYAVQIGKEIGLSNQELENLMVAGLLHDIGKIGTYDIILDKPGKLTDDEYEIVKKHPIRGSELLLPIKQLGHIIPWIKGHHERFNGTGYPDGLKGDVIPLQAKILSVADAFDSMTSDRPYRKTPGKESAIEELKRYAGTQFDPKVVEAFLKILIFEDIKNEKD
ncbi:MAG: HD domain-containing phosphohydrolase [Nitrospirota bacterium]